MKLYKRIINIIISILIFMMSIIPCSALVYAEDSETVNPVKLTNKQKDAINLLYSVGIIDSDDEQKLNLSGHITRAQAVSLCVRAMGADVAIEDIASNEETEDYLSTDAQGIILEKIRHYAELLLKEEQISSDKIDEITDLSQTKFSDVPKNHWAYTAVNTAVAMGMISGCSPDTFEPDNFITTYQACKILVCLGGYKIVAEHKGGYPYGYLNTAKDMDIDITSNDLTKLDFLVMLSQTIEAPLLKQETFGAKSEYVKDEDITLLSEIFDIKFASGIIEANAFASVSGKHADKNNVIINDTAFAIGKTQAFSMVGYKCKYYADYTDDYAII